MEDLPLLADGLMKVALLVGIMVLVATAPSARSASPNGWREANPDERRHHFCDDSDFDCRRLDDDDDDLGTSWMRTSVGPAVNVDGTPMSGDLDINGNPFGITNGSSSDDSHTCGRDWGSFEHPGIEWQSDAASDLTSTNDWSSSTNTVRIEHISHFQGGFSRMSVHL